MNRLALLLFRHYLMSARSGAVVRTVARLCLAAVAVGVSALIVVNSVMNGLNDSIRDRLLAVEPHVVVEGPQKDIQFWNALPWVSELEQRAGFEVQPFEIQDVIVRTNDGLVGGAVASGVEGETLQRLADQSRRLQGEGFDAVDSFRLGPGEAVMGAELARGLAIYEGDQITLVAPESLLSVGSEIPRFERLTITRLIVTNLPEIDSKMIYFRRGLSLGNLRDGLSRRTGLEIRSPNPFAVASLKAQIVAVVDDSVRVSTWIERNSSLFYALKIEKLAVGLLLALSTLIASFSISTVLTMLLVQKKQDVGILMALGLSPRQAGRAFFGLGLVLSGIGVVGGICIGLLVALSINRFQLPLLPDVYYQRTIPSRVDPAVVAILVSICATIAVLSSWLPSRLVTKGVSPSELIRSQRQNLGGLR